MPESFQRAVSTDLVSEVSDDGRTVTVRLVPWDRPHPVADRAGRQQYIETFVRGGLQVDLDRVLVEREHDGPIVGLLTSVEDRPDGLYGTIRMSRSAVGSDTLADIEARILRAVSVDFLDDPLPPGTQNVIRSSAQLRRVAFVMEPALDAPVLSVRSVPEAQNQESSTMTTEQVTPVDETVEETVEETVAPIVEQRSAPRVARAFRPRCCSRRCLRLGAGNLSACPR
jgi:hypothetical protein